MYPMFLINKPVTAQVGAKNLMYLKYLMLKNSKKFRIYSIRNPQKLERIGAPHGRFGIFHPFCRNNKKNEGWKKNGKKSQNPEKKLKGGPFSFAGILCSAKKGKLFCSVPGPKGSIWRLPLNFVELLVEIVWSLLVF